MKIYYNSKIAKLFTFIDGYKTIMLFGAVFTERDAISLKAEYHEGTHCNQYQALFATGFIIISIIALVSGLNGHAGWWMLWLLTIPVFLYYVWYPVEYLIRLCIYRNHKKAYHNIVEVDVFLVGGGGGSGNGSGAGSGYTKTYKRNNTGIKQGSQISVTPGQEINIIVGKGGAGLYYGYPEKGGFSQFMNSSYRAEGGNPSGNGLLNGENSTGGPYTGGNGGSGGSVDQSGDEFYAGSDGSDAPGITDGNGIYHPPGTKYGGGKGQGYTTRDFGEPTGKRNAGGGGADRNRDGGMGGESDYDEGCGIGRGNRKSGGYGGGGCGSEGTGGDGTVLIRGKRYKS